MRCLSIALIATLTAVPLQGQVVHRGAGAIAVSKTVTTTETAVIAQPSVPVFVPRGMILYVNIPVVVITDGRIFADFGSGYEYIPRSCVTLVSVTSFPVVTQPTVIQPVVTQPQPGLPTAVPVPYYPPDPNQVVVPRMQVVNAAGQPQAIPGFTQIVNTRACWSANGAGQVFVARPW